MHPNTLKFLTTGILLAASLTANAAEAPARPRVSLDGAWEFRMDPGNEGESGKWFDAGVAYPDKIQVPGNWQAQGFGEPKGHLRNDYQGVAWYRRTVEIPADWKGRQVWAHFGGVTAFGDVYVNGKSVGTVEHYLTPHEFNITSAVKFGETNTIACRVDSVASSHDPHRGPVIRPGPVGMFNFWGHWGGLYRPVWLEARPDPSIDTFFITPDIHKRVAQTKVSLQRGTPGKAWEGRLAVRITPAKGGKSFEAQGPVCFAEGKTTSEVALIDVAIPDARLWSPEDPFLYQATAVLLENGNEIDSKASRFGMREITARDGKILLNGTPYFIRGLGDDYVEPITGTMVPDKEVARERIQHCKDYGFNAFRYLGHTPAQEVFDAADELGFLILAEAAAYWNHWPRQDEVVPLYKKMVPQIIREFHNHPSWYAWSAGNEFLKRDAVWQDYLKTAHDTFKEMDPTRLFISSEGTNIQPMDVVTEANLFVGERLNQPFHGEVAEVAYFKQSLGREIMEDLAKDTPGYAEKVSRHRPSGYWRLNDKAAGKIIDSSGHGRDGAEDSTIPPESLGRAGLPDAGGGAVGFSADTPPLSLAAAISAFAGANEPFSFSLWLKPERFAPGDFGTPFSYGAAVPGEALLVSMDGEEAIGKVIIGQWGNNLIKSKGSLNAGEWNHLGVTYDGSRLSLFINGKPDSTVEASLKTKLADGKIGNVISKKIPETGAKPHLWHEFNNNYAGCLPDLSSLPKYTGVIAGNDCIDFHIKEIADYGLTGRYPGIRKRSIEFFTIYLKEVFEAARKSPSLDGYNYWLMTDLPGGIEGDPSSLGILNLFHEPDKFPDPEAIKRFNRESVLLMSADPATPVTGNLTVDGLSVDPPATDAANRIIADGAGKEVQLSISHYGTKPIHNGKLTWRVMDGTRVIDEGSIDGIHVEIGKIQELAKVVIRPKQTGRAAKLVLEAELTSPDFQQGNRWDFWFYPAQKRDFTGNGIVNLTGVAQITERYHAGTVIDPAQSRLVIADKMSPDVLDYVAGGGKVILLSERGALRNPVPIPFWPQVLKSVGTVIEDHPAVRDFPHDGFCNYPFFRLFNGATPALDLTTPDSPARKAFAPIVWGLKADTDPALGLSWDHPDYRTKLYRGGILSEGRIDRGKLIVSSLAVLDGIGKNLPEAAWFLDTLVDYSLADSFNPGTPPMTKTEAMRVFK